ncbi:hypothetical protein CYLTODRAFT_494470 [Cylindrobasidium torrendii FP15055 ss-10]|uniref:Uncharacterized protein n=1 Tax=Cylindrobasidium torrendii FP15055 ss-10 TaxID=1314674 RepID=A0A0D7AZK4_9AGAR|nr:hypothetical protein CYLTODRAFT_494470 [Cylindrobasidium torrendii FP15055 ss-10]
MTTTLILPVERNSVDRDLFYTSKPPRFLARNTVPPSLKTHLDGQRCPRYYLGWPFDLDDLADRGVPDATSAVFKATAAWIQQRPKDSSCPIGPHKAFIKYAYEMETCLWFVYITDNTDDTSLAYAHDEEYLKKMRELLPVFANDELIWIRSNVRR